MQKTLSKILPLLSAIILSSIVTTNAQNLTPVVYSPYTMYGLGDLTSPANISNRMMGGAGVALFSPNEINYLNPAALGAVRQQSALFSFAGEGVSNYLTGSAIDRNGSTVTTKSANNAFSLHDLGLAFPITRGVGLSVSLNPVTSVGYKTAFVDNNPQIVDQIGRAVYSYSGEGGISSVNASVGANLLKGLNIGATFTYYFGSIARYTSAEILPLLNDQAFYTMRTIETLNVSKASASFGAQYSTRVSKTGVLTFGATVQLQSVINAPQHNEKMLLSNNITDTISVESSTLRVVIPTKFTVGVAFTSDKFTAALDYSRQDWRNAFDTQYEKSGVALTVQNDIRLGLSFTPNRYDQKNVFNRWTYKLGFVYSSNYMSMIDPANGSRHQPAKIAGTLGFQIPLNKDPNKLTKLNVGVEVGQQGKSAFNQIKDVYFKAFVGFSFFGDDLWFVKRKFD